MRLLNFKSRHKEPGVIETDRMILRRPTIEDFSSWSKLRRESGSFLRPFEPTWTADELSKGAFRARLRRQEAEITSGKGLPWFLFQNTDELQLLGGLTISNIRRGVADTGTIGYWMGEVHAGQGFMREALEAICAEAFNNHQLHRLEAATVLENERSQRLLISAGFRREGVGRRYLKIDGNWRDHLLFARLADDPKPEPRKN